MNNPYLIGLDLVQRNCGTSGQSALAKCILSLYNKAHAFSISEVLAPLDSKYLAVVFAMLNEYGRHGETEELRKAGKFCYENFPRLIELSSAMSNARGDIYQKWEHEREEENRRLYPED